MVPPTRAQLAAIAAAAAADAEAVAADDLGDLLPPTDIGRKAITQKPVSIDSSKGGQGESRHQSGHTRVRGREGTPSSRSLFQEDPRVFWREQAHSHQDIQTLILQHQGYHRSGPGSDEVFPPVVKQGKASSMVPGLTRGLYWKDFRGPAKAICGVDQIPAYNRYNCHQRDCYVIYDPIEQHLYSHSRYLLVEENIFPRTGALVGEAIDFHADFLEDDHMDIPVNAPATAPPPSILRTKTTRKHRVQFQDARYSNGKDNDNYGPYSDPSLSPWIKERMEADMYKPYQQKIQIRIFNTTENIHTLQITATADISILKSLTATILQEPLHYVKKDEACKSILKGTKKKTVSGNISILKAPKATILQGSLHYIKKSEACNQITTTADISGTTAPRATILEEPLYYIYEETPTKFHIDPMSGLDGTNST
eukprot:jgi/Psemu1/16721/gm1.16721_g